MSARFSITLLDQSGNAKTGLDVDLYAGDGTTGQKVGDFIDNGDGTYYIDIASSGVYTVLVNGVIQTELQSIFIAVDDTLTTSDVVNNLVSTDTDKPLSAAMGKILQDNKADINHTHNASDINIVDEGGHFSSNNAEDALQEIGEIIGDFDLKETTYINNLTNITACLRKIDSLIKYFENYSTFNQNISIKKILYSHKKENLSPTGPIFLDNFIILNKDSFVDLIKLCHYKISTDNKITFNFMARHEAPLDYKTGNEKIRVGIGGTYQEIEIADESFDDNDFGYSVDIYLSDLNNDLYMVYFQAKNPSPDYGLYIWGIEITLT